MNWHSGKQVLATVVCLLAMVGFADGIEIRTAADLQATTGNIPNAFRYAFGIPASKDLADLDEPLISLSFVDGRPVLTLPEQVNFTIRGRS